MNLIAAPLRNGFALTRAAYRTFTAQDIGDVEVLFIDNASEDGTAQWLSTTEARVIHNQQPASVAASWNMALRWAFDKLWLPYVLVCNNDVELPPHYYRYMVRDGGPFVTGIGTDDPSVVTLLPTEEPATRPHPDFSAFLIRRECWQRVGEFDEGFLGAYAEDQDFHLRMHRAGIFAYCIDVPYYHVGAGAQTIKGTDEQTRRAIGRQADRNREYFQAKYGFAGGSPEYYAAFGHGPPQDEPLRPPAMLYPPELTGPPTPRTASN